MSERLRWGICATGRTSTDFTRDLQLVGGTVTAVGSRSREKAERFAEEFGIPHAHGSYEALVSDPDVDVVYIGTPNTSHAADALLALEAGKHVLVEKPFTLNAREARRVVDTAAERGLVVLEAMWTRWLPHMIRIRELIAEGMLGDVRGLIADHGLRLPDDPGHRVRDPKLGGGALLDLGIYPVSFAWDLFGEPDRVLAMAEMTATGVDATTSVVLGFPDGQQASLQTTIDARSSITAEIVGTEARIEIDSFWYFPTSFTVVDPSGQVLERFEHTVPGRGMQFQALEMERLVREGRIAGDILPPGESVAIMETLDEIRRQIGVAFPGDSIGDGEDGREQRMPWAYTLDGPGFVKRIERQGAGAPLEPGQVRLRFLAGGLCGSDMPLLQGMPVESVGGTHDGAPIHEIVGEVVESASESLKVGQRVVGTGGAAEGLAQYMIESDQAFVPIPDDFSDAEAVPIQSIGTVIRAANGLPDVRGKSVAVIGAGPIGLAFIHVLRDRGAAHITAVDPVPRREAALHYGADEFVPMQSARWVSTLDDADRPDIVIEAAGHQHATIRDAIRAVADWGYVLGFGAADDNEYVIPYREMYERGITLASGRTLAGWIEVLNAGRDYLTLHRADFADYITHTVPIRDAQTAYSLYARPQVSRIKVALLDED